MRITPVRITMVKKRLADGSPCEKCAQTEEMLRRRELWDRIDEVVWAIEGDDTSPGARLARTHGVDVAPFFVLAFEDTTETVYTSPLRLIRDHFSAPAARAAAQAAAETSAIAAREVSDLAERFAQSEPALVVRFALERFGPRCAIALTGAEDVVLVDMASRSGLPYRVTFVDSGRLHRETYALLDELRGHYGIEIACSLPAADALVALLDEKGPNSFLRDGHRECCGVRRDEPLARALRDCDAFIASHQLGRELCPASTAAVVELGAPRPGDAGPLVRFNPLLGWDANRVWSYIRSNAVPYNELYAVGYRQIGCQPCTRPIRPEQDEREGLWWWETGAGEAEPSLPGDGI